MIESNVSSVRDLDLCVSCELCRAVCPRDAVRLIPARGQYLPEVVQEKCCECGSCLEVCPGIHWTKNECITAESLQGNSIRCFTAYTLDDEVRRSSASGGLITTILTELVGGGEYEAAFVLPFDIPSEEPARLVKTHAPDEIIAASKSKYIPSSVYNVADALRSDKRKYVMVGTPCHVAGMKRFMESESIDRERVLFLGLFCEGIMNTNFVDFYEKRYRRKGESLVKLEFRTKDNSGWPGDSRLVFDSGRELFVDRQVRIRQKEYFRVNRCLFCPDKLNVGADISFGDCYVPGRESIFGNSNVIVRTEKGMVVWNRCSHLFAFQGVSVARIAKSQNLSARLENARFARLVRSELERGFVNGEETKRTTRDHLRARQKKLLLGVSGRYSRIRLSVCLERITRASRRLGTMLLVAVVAATSSLKSDMKGWFSARMPERKRKKNIIR